jgi:hypothetical protein
MVVLTSQPNIEIMALAETPAVSFQVITKIESGLSPALQLKY